MVGGRPLLQCLLLGGEGRGYGKKREDGRAKRKARIPSPPGGDSDSPTPLLPEKEQVGERRRWEEASLAFQRGQKC